MSAFSEIVRSGQRFILLMSMVAICWFSGCDIDGFELRLEIRGTVTDAVRGTGVSEAKVVLSRVRFGEETVLEYGTTRDDGRYEIIVEFGDEHECVTSQLVLTVEKAGYNKQFVTYNEITSHYVQCCTGVQTFDFQIVKF